MIDVGWLLETDEQAYRLSDSGEGCSKGWVSTSRPGTLVAASPALLD
jgi:hypothetical protein